MYGHQGGGPPSAKIIMLTISDEEADLYEAIKAGATGYLLKEISTDEVSTAIRAVADGSPRSARRWRPNCSPSSSR